MAKISYKNQSEFHLELLEIVASLSQKIEAVQNCLSDNLEKTPGKTYHLLSNILSKPQTKTQELVYKYILSMAYRAEITSSGAGYHAVAMFLDLVQEGIKTSLDSFKTTNEPQLLAKLDGLYQNIFQKINAVARPITKTELFDSVESLSEDVRLAKVVNTALELAGLEGKIFVENGKTDQFIVEAKNGYEFKCKPFDWFLDKFNNTWNRQHCKVLLVDGLIENVSEIETILQELYAHKQPMLFVAHGFSEEVVATLKANQEKGNFDAIPVRIMPDVNSINMINDISCVCNADHVTHLKGQLLTFIKYEDLPTVDYVKCQRDRLVIENRASLDSVNAQIKHLLQKRQAETEIEDIQNILDQRLKSLVGNSVIIHLPDESSTITDSYRIKIDNALRNTKALINYGVCNMSELTIDAPKDDIERLFVNMLEKTKNRQDSLSVLTISIATLLAYKSAIMFLSAKGAVVNQQ